MKRKFISVVVLLALALVSCHKRVYLQHPGAINAFDSQAYDALIVAQSTIAEAQAEFAAGKLPVSAKEVINKAVKAYNVAREAWLASRAGATGDLAGVQQAFQELTTDLLGVTRLRAVTP